jgi:hypothetical protein
MRWLLLCILAMPAAAIAGDSGDELRQKCEDSSDVSFGYCFGYIRGTIESAEYARTLRYETIAPESDAASAISAPPALCIPADVTLGQLQKVIAKYMDNHPDELHRSASVLTIEAVSKAFPCQK